MAIFLAPAGHIPKTQQFFQQREEIKKAEAAIGKVDGFINPLCDSVGRYCIKKAAGLISENTVWRGNGNTDPRSFTYQTAKSLILSKNFGMTKIRSYTSFCFYIKSFLRAKGFSELPHDYQGIGADYFEHMPAFLRLLWELADLAKGRRLEMMGGIRLKKDFIDKCVGQFIAHFFWFMVHAGKFPRENYRFH
ncbi:MAG TPA: hypothetical protein VK254_01380 [Candidatus Bathyarchaeia archaeon]|nr:hypothetical protein [Candidatus Bathyarchaeia archaeon]